MCPNDCRYIESWLTQTFVTPNCREKMAQGCNTFKTPEQMASKDVKMPGTEIGEKSVSQLEDV